MIEHAADNTIGFSKDSLVLNADGRCQAWQGLLIASLNIQNISATPVSIRGKPFSSGGVTYPAQGLQINGTLLGQGGTNTASYFVSHAIVHSDAKIVGSLYDPSYGNPYEGTTPKNAWELASLDYVGYRLTADTPVRKREKASFPNEEICDYTGY